MLLGVQLQEDREVMVERRTGEWQTETQPFRHTRREARWALEDCSRFRLPIVGKADVPLQTVGAPTSAEHVHITAGGIVPESRSPLDAVII